MATEARKQELKDKLTALVADRFEGNFRKAFEYYDRGQDGKLDKAELKQFLKDANVGNWLSRGAWADGIIKELDTDGDGKVSGAELQAALKR